MNRASLNTAVYILATLLGQSGPARAQGGPIAEVLCASPDDMRQRLDIRYQARRAWAGLRSPDEVLELWEDAEGDWTLVITHAGGNWCIVAMGEALDPVAELPHG